LVELKNVSVTYSSGVDALNNVSLKINDGDFAFVVGSSGAGKSTMIKLLLKEIDATSGVVTVNGYNLNKLKKRKIPEFRRTLGFVFQDFRLIPSMTVYENIAFVLRVIDAPIKYIRKRVPYVISLVGLHAKTNSYPDELSGGEKQRVAIARALVNDPQLIIADEPTGNIDPELSYEIVELLKGINDQGTTILMVTHEHDLVRHFGGRIINITEGEIVFDEVITGTNDELLADMDMEMPSEAMAAAISEAERINDHSDGEVVNTEDAIDLPIENMTADDIISAIGGVPEGKSEKESKFMPKVADNIDVDLTE
jgi:cell division ATP-binding protein FtsE